MGHGAGRFLGLVTAALARGRTNRDLYSCNSGDTSKLTSGIPLPLVPDTYSNYSELSRCEVNKIDFRVLSEERNSNTISLAPHGGGIEPGTSELAMAIAGSEFSYYLFEGLKSSGNSNLHITSHLFDEPQALRFVGQHRRVVAIHGERSLQTSVYVGGLDQQLRESIQDALTDADFKSAEHHDETLQGHHAKNICNRGASGKGVQLELPKGLRQTFFESLDREGRRTKTDAFFRFVNAIRMALLL